MKKGVKIAIGVPIGVVLLFGIAIIGFFVFADPAEAIGGNFDLIDLNDGTFEGHYRNGPNRAHVEVTIDKGEIKDIKIIRNVASWIGKKATDIIPIRILKAQSTSVDAVTGATNSSRVIMNAVEMALEESRNTDE